jgi:limonene-1,2-epoxide hydrolase
MRIEIHRQLVSGDTVMNERTDYFTIGAREIVLPVCGVFEIHDGHIKAWREYFDMAPVTGG